jgi:hypothetical protein
MRSLDDDPSMEFRRSISNAAGIRPCLPTAGLLALNLLVFLLSGSLRLGSLHAADAPIIKSVGRPVIYQQDSFILHTDLPKDIAHERLAGLNQLIHRLDAYWDSHLQGTIECYVVADLAAWPVDSFPAEALEKLKLRSAVTLTDRLRKDDQVLSIKSIVYATNHVENLHHEVVHAYCWQTFQRCGPAWYAEGMAEVLGWSHNQTGGVRYFDWALKYLRAEKNLPTVTEVVTEPVSKRPLWQTYARRWALCYVLMSDPRYAERFRKFGQQLLRGEDVNFTKSFADVLVLMANDYRKFQREARPGFEFPAQINGK